MINHVRTLLLNTPSAGLPAVGYPGFEFVDPAYAPRTLPTPLQDIYRLLFGDSPDQALLNWRLREYMGILHSSEVSEYVLALDPRITYLPFNDDLLDLVTA